MQKTITVFGSSKPLPGEEEYESAYILGRLLAEKGFNVCCGGYYGIMEAVSKGAAELGKEAIGVTVDLFNAIPNTHLTSIIECESLFDRIEKLLEIGDGFVVLRGGTGTLLELSVIWEMINKNLMPPKPIICFGQMWKPLIELMDKRMEFENRATGLINYFDNEKDCVEFLTKIFQPL